MCTVITNSLRLLGHFSLISLTKTVLLKHQLRLFDLNSGASASTLAL